MSNKKEKTVPKQITLGMKSRPYWDRFYELCQKAGRSPSDIIHKVLDKWLPDEVKYLEMEEEFQEKIRKERGRLEREHLKKEVEDSDEPDWQIEKD